MATCATTRSNDRFFTTPTRYNGDSYIGKYGLELLYEDELLGTNGRFHLHPNQGRRQPRHALFSTKAVDGNDLHLTIIPELQERLEVRRGHNGVYDQSIHGCVIVINPKTGAIEGDDLLAGIQPQRSFPRHSD